MTLESVIAAHWAKLIPTPAPNPLRVEMEIYIQNMKKE